MYSPLGIGLEKRVGAFIMIRTAAEVSQEAADALDLARRPPAATARTKILKDELDEAFRRWYPKFRVQSQMHEPVQKTA
jgi:hypothetical protein